LIELLIVVAIIAILAAIAVPNFLEAQTRAKVSRVYTDMRSVNVAMEMYHVDNNRYMPALSRRDIDGQNETPTYLWGISLFIEWNNGTTAGNGDYLTTPIAYLSSIPKDPFLFMAGRQDRYASAVGAHIVQAGAWYFATNGYDFDQGGGQYFGQPGMTYRLAWFLGSPGPDIYWFSESPQGANVYDPTNGTISNGDIFYLNKHGFLGGGIN